MTQWKGSYRFAIVTVILCVYCSFALDGAIAESINYQNPPKCEVWLEGENCTDHNWIDGPAYHCWAYGYAGIHGGVLDLASWRLPDEGVWVAKFPFRIAKDGQYFVYYLGRSTYQASPFEWQMDDAPAMRYPPKGSPHSVGEIASVCKIKYAITKLGPVPLKAGKHHLTITVREPVVDVDNQTFYSQQIDTIGIGRVEDAAKAAAYPLKPSKKGYQELWTTADIDADNHSAESGKASTEKTSAALWSGDFVGKGSTETKPTGTPLIAEGTKHQKSTISVGVSTTKCALTRLLSDEKGHVLAKASSIKPLFSVKTISGTMDAGSGELTWKKTSEGRIADFGGKGFTAKVIFKKDSVTGEFRITAQITNTSKTTIDTVQWSVLDGISLGGDSSDDWWLVGSEKYKASDIPTLQSNISPLNFRFDWVCVYDKSDTLYVYFEDSNLLDTRALFSGGDATKKGGSLAFQKYPRIDPGETWQTPTLVLGAYASGDWHRAADRFREWWYSWAKSPVIPDWFKAMGAMGYGGEVNYYDQLKGKPFETILDANRQTEKTFRNAGVTLLHSGGWLPLWTEGWYPLNYELSTEYLRLERKLFHELRKSGARYSFYSNPLMFSRVTPHYETFGKRLTVRAADGNLVYSEHDARHHPMALPWPGEEWAEYFVRAFEPIVALIQPDNLYLDQLGAVGCHLDYSTNHGHRHFGEWTSAEMKFCKRVIEKLRPYNPDMTFGIECPSPAIQQYVTYGYLVYSDWANTILRYTFPTYVHAVGYIAPVDEKTIIHIATQSFLTGLPMVYWGITNGKPCPGLVSKILLSKQKWDPILYQGRYIDTVGLSSGKDVEVRAFAFSDGRLILPFVNLQNQADQTLLVDTEQFSGLSSLTAEYISVDAPDMKKSLNVEMKNDTFYMEIPNVSAGLIFLKRQ
jgi:hypothetical protein